MKLFLVSIGMIFGSTLVGFFVMRVDIENWPSDLPPMPWSLAVSSVLLILSSVTMQMSLHGAQASDPAATRRYLGITMAIGVIFLVIQAWAWMTWLDGTDISWQGEKVERFALTGFYVLTGLHAAHVIGGLIPMWITFRGAAEGRYTDGRHGPVLYCTMYWHFLDGVWLILYAVLMLFV